MDKKQYLKEYYLKNSQRLSAQKAVWYLKNRDRLLKKNSLYVKENKDSLNIKRKLYPSYKKKRIYKKKPYKYYRYSEIYKEKQKIRRKVRYAIEKGRLIRLPCQICGDKISEAHHENYAEPLNVMWLCRIHHTELHKKKVFDN